MWVIFIPQGRSMEKVYYGKLTEDDVLVESLEELCGDPTWRADNGDFKDGYLVQLETMMETKIPGCQIKAAAIESRVNSLKKKYFAVTDMKTLFGLGWDEDRMMIIGDKSVYDGWVKISKRERKLFDRPFRHYYALKRIYGKDGASDEDSGASGNAYNNVKTQEEILGANLGTTVKIEPQVEGHNIRTFSEISATVADCGRRVRNRVMEDNQPEKSKNYGSVEACVAAMELKIDYLINVLSSDKEVADLQAKLDNELSKIEGLSELQVFRATNILASKLDLLRVFFGMSEERKKIYVLNLLMHGL
ncbi:hypothetical protein UlMin_008736 [Ulmus minor]